MGGGAPVPLLKASLSQSSSPGSSGELASRPHSFYSNTCSAAPCLAQGGGREWGPCTDIPTPKFLGNPGLLVCAVTLERPHSSPVTQIYYTSCISQPKIPQTYLSPRYPNSRVEAPDLSSSLLSHSHTQLPPNLSSPKTHTLSTDPMGF